MTCAKNCCAVLSSDAQTRTLLKEYVKLFIFHAEMLKLSESASAIPLKYPRHRHNCTPPVCAPALISATPEIEATPPSGCQTRQRLRPSGKLIRQNSSSFGYRNAVMRSCRTQCAQEYLRRFHGKAATCMDCHSGCYTRNLTPLSHSHRALSAFTFSFLPLRSAPVHTRTSPIKVVCSDSSEMCLCCMLSLSLTYPVDHTHTHTHTLM